MALDDLSLQAYQRVEERADLVARAELRWTSALDHALVQAVLAGATADDLFAYTKSQYHRTVRSLADAKHVAMREMTAKRTKGDRR